MHQASLLAPDLVRLGFGHADGDLPIVDAHAVVVTDAQPLAAAERADIEFGWQMAKEMGRLDIGQSVAVSERACVAVEAMEGTDAMLRRAASLVNGRGLPQFGYEPLLRLVRDELASASR